MNFPKIKQNKVDTLKKPQEEYQIQKENSFMWIQVVDDQTDTTTQKMHGFTVTPSSLTKVPFTQ